MHRIVISNTSPIFYLHRTGYLNVLKKLYGEIVVPAAVVAELEEGEKVGEDVPRIAEYNWISVHWSKIRFDEKFIAINDVVHVMPAGYSKLASQLGSVLD